MRRRDRWLIAMLAGALGLAAAAAEAQVVELQGAWLIDGYSFQPGDRSPRGTIAYDTGANVFTGTYVGLKLPADRADLHAWLAGSVGKDKGTFRLALPDSVRGGAFKPYEIVAFSAEVPGTKPKAPR